MNAREEVLARIAAAHRIAPPPELGYEDISREYRTTSDSETAQLTELLIDRLVDYRALVRESRPMILPRRLTLRSPTAVARTGSSLQRAWIRPGRRT